MQMVKEQILVFYQWPHNYHQVKSNSNRQTVGIYLEQEGWNGSFGARHHTTSPYSSMPGSAPPKRTQLLASLGTRMWQVVLLNTAACASQMFLLRHPTCQSTDMLLPGSLALSKLLMDVGRVCFTLSFYVKIILEYYTQYIAFLKYKTI